MAGQGISTDVRNFYRELPFNYEKTAADQAQIIRSVDQIAVYRPLAAHLGEAKGVSLLDAGCGVGWLACTAALWYGSCCLGIDFSDKAVARAREVRSLLGLDGAVEFSRADIFDLPPEVLSRRFDVVASLGVLHHTRDCFQGLVRLYGLLEEKGHLLLGLYHAYGRKPLLDAFSPLRDRLQRATDKQEQDAILEQGIKRWNDLFAHADHATFNLSWFRDQCLHPHETQWTLRDVLAWFRQLGITPLATSLDRFSADPDWQRLVENEKDQESLARKRLCVEKKFFPGFFVVWARKK